jgi:bacteriocin biosynthesis cyclodehydratase domain-containing protein
MIAARIALHVIGAGRFGAAVAEAIVDHSPGTVVTLTDGDVAAGPAGAPGLLPGVPGLLPGATAHLLAAGAAMPGYATVLDRVAFERRVPWLPVIVEHPLLRVGPAVVPGAGACYSCWRRRLRQHAVAPDIDAALERTSLAAGGDGPAGHLPAVARLAAAVALDVVGRLARRETAEAGRVRQLDLLTRRLTTGAAVGVHGCPRCGLGRDEPARSHRQLLADLAEVWA